MSHHAGVNLDSSIGMLNFLQCWTFYSVIYGLICARTGNGMLWYTTTVVCCAACVADFVKNAKLLCTRYVPEVHQKKLSVMAVPWSLLPVDPPVSCGRGYPSTILIPLMTLAPLISALEIDSTDTSSSTNWALDVLHVASGHDLL